MPVFIQMVWIAGFIGLLLTIKRWPADIKKTPLLMAGIGFVFILSYHFFRVEYNCVFEDGELGAPPGNMHFPPITDFNMPTLTLYRLPFVLCFALSRILPPSFNFDYIHCLLFRNFELDNTWFLITLAAGALVVGLVTIMVFKIKSLTSPEKLGLQLFLICSSPMINAYGYFKSYIILIFFVTTFFICMWLIAQRGSPWRIFLILALLLPFWLWTHEFMFLLPCYIALLLCLRVLQQRNKTVPWWIFIGMGIIIGLLPVLTRVMSPAILERVFGYRPGLFIFTQLNACVMIFLPAFLLVAITFFHDRSILNKPTPIQGTCLVILTANVFMFFLPIMEPSPPTMIHNYGPFGALIYGSAATLFLSSQAPKRIIVYLALLSVFIFVPTIYVHSNRLIYERFMKIVPQDFTARWSRDMSPYVFMGLVTPIDSEQDRQARLDWFKSGYTTTVPEWQEFRGLNFIYYTAWCFEFGKTEEGTQALLQAFSQPQMLMDLWSNGTRFTDRYENKAYRRIRNVSRQIIMENLKRDPKNETLRQLSSILDQYEKQNP